jgi:hypothetical protein
MKPPLVCDNADDDIVGHQLSPVHDLLGLEADRRAGGHSGAEHVAR